jgi:ABC-2 type transport system ATP-binding protein
MQNSVELDRLSKTFILNKRHGWRRTTEPVLAVNGISLAIPVGQSVAFIGPNGAGKSTTIKMLTGILHPTSGQAQVLGFTPWKERSRLTYHIGVVFGQRSQLWYHLPPRDTFDLLARVYSLDKDGYCKRRDMLIERFDLGPFLETPVRKLSLGQRMRAVVARQELRDLIREWNRDEGLTVFLTSHDAGDIERVARRVVVINHGCIVFDDKVSTMRRRYLNSKILSVRFAAPPSPIDLPGVTVLKSTEYALKLQVDTGVAPIESVMVEVLKAGSVADIAIEDPPLEEVIAHIYNETSAPVEKAEKVTEP